MNTTDISKARRLRHVGLADFRKSAKTMLAEVLDENPALKLEAHDVIVAVSLAGDQLLFIHGPDVVEFQRAGSRARESFTCLDSQRLQLFDGRWNPYKLEAYAARKGIVLINFKSFITWYNRLQQPAQREQRRQAA